MLERGCEGSAKVAKCDETTVVEAQQRRRGTRLVQAGAGYGLVDSVDSGMQQEDCNDNSVPAAYLLQANAHMAECAVMW